MKTNNARAEICGVLATVWVFRQTIRDIESFTPISRPTFCRIWNTLLIINRAVGHGRPVFSKLRRPGWMQSRQLVSRNAYWQVCGPSTWHSEKGKPSPRLTARHFSGSGSFCSLIVSSVTNSPRRDLHQSCRAVENQLKPLVQKEFSKEPIRSVY
jgi:hypothetical protein